MEHLAPALFPKKSGGSSSNDMYPALTKNNRSVLTSSPMGSLTEWLKAAVGVSGTSTPVKWLSFSELFAQNRHDLLADAVHAFILEHHLVDVGKNSKGFLAPPGRYSKLLFFFRSYSFTSPPELPCVI